MTRICATVLTLVLASSAAAAGRPIARGELGASPYLASTPQIAFARGAFLTVWSESLDPAHARILGMFSDASGRRMTRMPFVIVRSEQAAQLELLATDDGFFLFELLPGAFIRMRVLDASGTLQSTHTIEIRATARPAFAWNGHALLIAVDTSVGGYAVRVDPEGKMLSSKRLQRSIDGAAAVPLGDGFLVLFGGQAGLSVARVAADGKVKLTVLAPNPTAALTATPLPDGETAIAWVEVVSPSLVVHRGVLRSDGALANSEIVGTMESVFGLQLTPRGVLLSDWHALHYFARGDHATIGLADILQPETASSENLTLLARISGGFVNTVAIDANGIAQTPEPLSFALAYQMAPFLGSAGGTALALWTERSGAAWSLRAAALQPNGEPFAPFLIATNAFPVSRQLAWSGTEYLTVLLSGNTWLAQRLSRWGSPLGDPIVLGTLQSQSALAAVSWAGDRWVVFYAEGSQPMMAAVMANGVLASKREIALPATSSFLPWAAVFEGERGVLAWTADLTTSPATHAVRISRDGDLLGTPATLDTPDDFALDLAIASNGTEVAIVHDRWTSMHADFFRFDGGAASPSTAIDLPFGAGSSMGVVWDGSTFVAALHWDPTRILLTRLGTPGFTTVKTDVTLDSRMSLTSPLPGHLLFGVQEISAEGPHAVTYTDDDAMNVRRHPSP